MDWTQDTFCYILIASLTTAFFGAMLVYVRSAQLEPQQPVTDGSLQNKRKIRKKEKGREKRVIKKISVIAPTVADNASSDETVSQNDPLGLGIDPLYAPKSTKKIKTHKPNAQPPNKPTVSQQEEPIKVDLPVIETKVKPEISAPPQDDVDAPVAVLDDDHSAPKDVSTDSGIPSDVPEPVIAAPQKPQKHQSKSKTKAEDKSLKKPVKVETDAPVQEPIISPAPVSVPVETVQGDIQPQKAVEPQAETKVNKKKSKKNRLSSESGQNLIESVLELIDDKFYNADTVQCLITALTDYGQTGAKDAWTKMNDPEEKYHKRLNQLEILAEQNLKHIKTQDDIIAGLRNDLRKHEQSEKRLMAVRKELEAAISLRKNAEIEINALTEKLKKAELKFVDVESIKLEKDKYIEDLTLALNKAHNDLAQKDSDLEDANARYRQLEIKRKEDFDQIFHDLDVQSNQQIAAFKANFESEKNLLLQEKDKELQNLSMQLAATENTIGELNGILTSERALLAGVNAELESLKRECNSLKAFNSQLETQLSKANQADSTLQIDFKELQSAFKNQQDDFGKKLSEKDNMIEKLKESSSISQKMLDESDKKMIDLGKQLANANKIFEDQEASNKNLKQLSDKLVKDLSESKATNAKLTENLNKVTADYESVCKQNKDAASRLETAMKNHKDELFRLQNKCSELEKQLSQKQTKAPSSKSNDDVLRQKTDLENRNSVLSKKLEETLRYNFEMTNQIKQLKSNPPSPVPLPSPSPVPVADKQQVELTQAIESMAGRVQSVATQITKMQEHVSKYLSEHSPVPEMPAYMSGDSLSSSKDVELMSAKAESISKTIDLITKTLANSLGETPKKINNEQVQPKSDQQLIQENESLRNQVTELKSTVNKLHTVVQLNTHSSYLDQSELSQESSNNKSQKKKNNHSRMNGNNQTLLDINGN